MTSVAEPVVERYDVRTIVGGGAKLGALCCVAVVLFALLSRVLSGTAEGIVQSILIIAGGALASLLPAVWVRPRGVDSIAWSALIGLIGALVFTLFDTVALRPLGIYHWTWDAIGGGSGFWYIPVWWMGATLLAWLGAWAVAIAGRGGARPHVGVLAGQLVVLTGAVFAVLTLARIAPASPGVVALAFVAGLVLSVPLTRLRSRR
jgi:hypothetical protein